MKWTTKIILTIALLAGLSVPAVRPDSCPVSPSYGAPSGCGG